PGHADESERDETHHHRVKRIFRTYQPAVEKCERGSHQENERGRHEHPRGVGLIHLDPPVRSATKQVLPAAITRFPPLWRRSAFGARANFLEILLVGVSTRSLHDPSVRTFL